MGLNHQFFSHSYNMNRKQYITPHTQHHIGWMTVAAALTMCMTSCLDDTQKMQYTFNATMEQLQNADNPKVQLINEEWTYWEGYDSINVISNASATKADGTNLYTGWLVGGGYPGDFADYDGVFITTLTERDNATSQWFLGIHPARYDKHKVAYSSGKHGFTANVYLDPIQYYRHDSSYARQLLPMIATYDGDSWAETGTPYRLDFHALASIVRLQLVNGTGSAQTITKIELTSLTPAGGDDTITQKPLSGLFPVKNLYNFNAHLDADNGTDVGYTLTLSTSGSESTGSMEFASNDIKSFYIVLPAFHGMDTTTYFHLQMTVYNSDGNKCSKKFTVRTRRNGITYLRAINITEFDDGSGVGTPVLVGNGTSTRPFKIYTTDDLIYVRDRFNSPDESGKVYVNGQEVTSNTWFRIMRSDIVLTNDNWNSGIEGFTGHLTYYTNSPLVTHGITNRSTRPLFKSISEDGYVNDLNVICDQTINITDASITESNYSPFCFFNEGHITDCRILSPTSISADDRRFFGKGAGGSVFAGICVTNDGTITGASCSVIRKMVNNSNFAGVCLTNNGTVTACIASSPMEVSDAINAAGICYTNSGTVADCYCDFHHTTGNTNWGGIVYNNTTGSTHVVRNCYFSTNGIIRSTGNVGGIVCINEGVVDYCRAERGTLRGSIVGGIVATVSGGEVRNCYANDSNMVIYQYNNTGTDHSAGGIAGLLSGGTIKNCFALINHIDIAAADITGMTGTVVGNISSGGTVNNCYGLSVTGSSSQFYGENHGTLTNCFLVGGTQTGVTHIDGAHSVTGNLNDLCELREELDKLGAPDYVTYTGWSRDTLATDPNNYNDKRAPYLNSPYAASKHSIR